jgi:hypothetical protein
LVRTVREIKMRCAGKETYKEGEGKRESNEMREMQLEFHKIYYDSVSQNHFSMVLKWPSFPLP